MNVEVIFKTMIDGELSSSISFRGTLVMVLYSFNNMATMACFDYRRGSGRYVCTGLDDEVSPLTGRLSVLS